MKHKRILIYTIPYFIVSILQLACNNISVEVDTIDSVRINKKSELIADLINLDHTYEENWLKDYNDTLYKMLREKAHDFVEINIERDSNYFFNYLTSNKWKINIIRYHDENGERVQYISQKDSLIIVFFGKDWNIYDIDKKIIGEWEIKTYDGPQYDVEVIGLRFNKKIIAPIKKFEYYDFVYFSEDSKIFHLENIDIYRKYVFAGLKKKTFLPL